MDISQAQVTVPYCEKSDFEALDNQGFTRVWGIEKDLGKRRGICAPHPQGPTNRGLDYLNPLAWAGITGYTR